MQHEITKRGPLLDQDGMLREPGWSRRMLLAYDRGAIHAGKLRIKEWDYYIVANEHHGVAFTVADNGYMGLISASMLDFDRAWEHTSTVMKILPLGKYRMPPSSESGDVEYWQKGLLVRYVKQPERRILFCEYENFHEGKPLKAEIELCEPAMDTMVIATPFEKPGRFYYNQKINCMPASGYAEWGGLRFSFAPETAFGTLDWGRGVWTYDNTWYWGSGNGVVAGKPFGFNIGYGFGDTSAATENVIHYDGRAHKIEEVRFNIPQDSFMKPWTFSSSDGRFEMDFQPVLDRYARTNALVLETDQHQVFGKFTGKAVLDDGTALEIRDLLGFAEKVRNRY